MKSFRASLALRMALGVLGLLAAAAIVSVLALRKILYDQLDGTLLHLAEVEAQREQLYSGPCFAAAPDLCVLSNYGYDLKGAVNKQELMDREVFTGMHTQDDALLFINKPRNSLRPDKPHINDVAPTVLDSLGLSVPQAMDGRSLLK